MSSIRALIGKKAFSLRLLVFFVFYVVSLVFHSNLTEWLYGYGVNVQDEYLLFFLFPVLVLFIAFRRKQILEFNFNKGAWRVSFFFFILGLVCFFIPVRALISDYGLNSIMGYFTPILIGYFLVFVSVFGLRFVKLFRKELFLIVVIVMGYLFTEVLIEQYWGYSSKIILYFLTLYLPLFSSNTVFDSSVFLVKVEDFTVFIGPPCAGIYSLVTFILLYLASLNLAAKSRSIHWVNALLMLLVGGVVVYFLNVVRIGVIVLIGAFYSPALAIDFFHEYLSAILLLSLFLIYLYFVIPRITYKKSSQ